MHLKRVAVMSGTSIDGCLLPTVFHLDRLEDQFQGELFGSLTKESECAESNCLRKVLMFIRAEIDDVLALARFKLLERLLTWLRNLEFNEHGSTSFGGPCQYSRLCPGTSLRLQRVGPAGNVGNLEFLLDVEWIMCPYCRGRLEYRW